MAHFNPDHVNAIILLHLLIVRLKSSVIMTAFKMDFVNPQLQNVNAFQDSKENFAMQYLKSAQITALQMEFARINVAFATQGFQVLTVMCLNLRQV